MSLDEALQRSVDSALPGDGVSGALLFKFTPNALSPLASSWFLLAVTGTFPPCWTALSHPVGCMLCKRVQRPLLGLGGHHCCALDVVTHTDTMIQHRL